MRERVARRFARSDSGPMGGGGGRGGEMLWEEGGGWGEGGGRDALGSFNYSPL